MRLTVNCVTSGAVPVFGLVWKGQTPEEDRKRRAIPGAGFGSDASVQGEGGVCILPSISGLHGWEQNIR